MQQKLISLAYYKPVYCYNNISMEVAVLDESFDMAALAEKLMPQVRQDPEKMKLLASLQDRPENKGTDYFRPDDLPWRKKQS